MAAESGLAQPAVPTARIFGDLDRGRFLDFRLGNGQPSHAARIPSVMFLDQEGRRRNRAAIGARIHGRVEDADGAPRSIYRHVNSGGTFGHSRLRQTIALGPARRVVSLGILWPTSATLQHFEDVGLDQGLHTSSRVSRFSNPRRCRARRWAPHVEAGCAPRALTRAAVARLEGGYDHRVGGVGGLLEAS